MSAKIKQFPVADTNITQLHLTVYQRRRISHFFLLLKLDNFGAIANISCLLCWPSTSNVPLSMSGNTHSLLTFSSSYFSHFLKLDNFCAIAIANLFCWTSTSKVPLSMCSNSPPAISQWAILFPQSILQSVIVSEQILTPAEDLDLVIRLILVDWTLSLLTVVTQYCLLSQSTTFSLLLPQAINSYLGP